MFINLFSFTHNRKIGLLSLIVAVACLLPSPRLAVAEDYGVDQIEDLESPLPLPVEMVEEKPVEQPATTPTTAEAAADEPQSPDGGSITTILDVRDADLTALVKAISKATKRNFIIDNRLKGKVTVHLPTPVSQAEALKIFDSVLLLNGFTTVPAGKNIWKILPTKEAKQSTIPLIDVEQKDRSDVLVTELLQLKYIKAEEMQQLLAQFISGDGGINSFAGTNSLLVIDSARNIARVRNLIEQLDVPAKDQDITIIPVLYADAKDVAEKVQQILGEDSKNASGGPNMAAQAIQPSGRSSKSSPKFAQGQNVSSRALPIKIIPDERTNSIIVVADPEMTTKVRVLCQKLDSEMDRSGGRFYVYRLKHADAEDLAEMLNSIISGTPMTSTKKDNSGSSLSRSSRKSSDNSSGSDNMFSSSRNRSSRTRQTSDTAATTTKSSGGGAKSGDATKSIFEGEIYIGADTSTNSLIISASKGDYQRVKEVIEELDVKRRQVLVEATILEVSMSKDEGMGIELQGSMGNDDGAMMAQTNWGNLTNLVTSPSSLSDLTVAAASTGTITLPGGLVLPSQAVLVSALSSNSNVNVLSTPTILSTDNEEAEIVVGENIPFITGRSSDSSNLSNTYNEIEREDVGITLRITPQISSNNYVLLRIFVEISNVVSGTRNDTNGPTTTIRTTETTVEVKSDQMIVTGGLLSDAITDSTDGIPYLKDIPVLGQLFRRDDQNTKRSNLLMFITPRIIFDQYEARDKTKELANRMEEDITSHGVLPDRNDILHKDNIDRVAEEAEDIIQIPTTVTSANNKLDLSPEAAAALERTKKRFAALAHEDVETPRPTSEQEQPVAPNSEEPQTVNEEELNITVKPQLPSARTETSSLNAPSVYVVLRELEHTVASPTLKFADDRGTIGLKINVAPQQGDEQSFRAGSRYTYDDQGVERSFVVLGRFNTQAEAGAIAKSLRNTGDWNLLSEQSQNNWLAQ